VNVLDENVTRDQADLLWQWGIRFRSISRDLGGQGMPDENIVPFLLRLKQPTFLTRDEDFFERGLLHARYALVWLGVDAGQPAFFIRLFLRHPSFRANAQRLGKVISVKTHGIEYWAKGSEELIRVEWPRAC
jgi:hypothetical protein